MLENTSSRYITADPRDRFGIYRLCDCPTCEGKGKARQDSVIDGLRSWMRCPDCRGEGRIRQELATCASEEAVGVALCTLGREGEFEGCPVGLLERGAGKDGAGKWLILPWLPSPRNVSDAGRTLSNSRKQ